jgi:hypothetical protein
MHVRRANKRLSHKIKSRRSNSIYKSDPTEKKTTKALLNDYINDKNNNRYNSHVALLKDYQKLIYDNLHIDITYCEDSKSCKYANNWSSDSAISLGQFLNEIHHSYLAVLNVHYPYDEDLFYHTADTNTDNNNTDGSNQTTRIESHIELLPWKSCALPFQRRNLMPYYHASKYQSNGDVDYLLNCCGSCWAISFYPHSTENNIILAVGTYDIGYPTQKVGLDIPHLMMYDGYITSDMHKKTTQESYSHSNLIQIWTIPLINLASSNDSLPYISYYIKVSDCGTIWKLEWNKLLRFHRSSNVFGCLAVISNTSNSNHTTICRIILAPIVDDINSSAESDVMDCDVYDIDDMHSWVLGVEGVSVYCFSWHPHDPYIIICGMSDGSIGLWNLNNIFPNNFEYEANNINSKLIPPQKIYMDNSLCKSFEISHTAIRCISFCPYNSDLFATGGHDDALKVFYISNYNL